MKIKTSKLAALTRFSGFFFVQVVSRGVSLLTVPIFTRYLSPSEYGVASSCLAVATALPLLLYLCSWESIYFDALRGKRWDHPDIKSPLAFLFMTALAGLIVAALLSIVAPESWKYLPTGLLTAVIGILSVFYTTILLYFQATSAVRLYSLVSLTFMGMLVGGRLLFTTVFDLHAVGFLLGDVIANSFGLLLAVGIFFRAGGFKNIELQAIKNSVRFGMPLIVHNFAHWGRFQVTVLLLTAMVSTREAGLFHIANTYAGVLAMFLEVWKTVSNPYMFALMDKPALNAQKMNARVSACLVLIVSAAVVGLMLFPLMMGTVISKQFEDAWKFVPLLLIGHIALVPYFNIVTTLFYDSKTTSIATVTFLSSIVGVAAAYSSLRFWSVEGAAFGVIVSSFSMSLFSAIWSYRKHKIRWAMTPTLIAMLLIFGFYFVHPHSAEFWILCAVILGAGASYYAASSRLGTQAAQVP